MTDHSELKRLAEDCKSSSGIELMGARVKFHAAANPTVVLALISEVEALKSDSLCPECEGSGEGWVRSDNGPDAHNIQIDCPDCSGSGTLYGAYQTTKIQRDSLIERTVKAGGNLLFMRSERDQLKAEVEALRSQVAALQSDPNSWQSGYDEGRSIGTKTALDERGQLRTEVEALRKDAERYRFLKARTQQADIELAVCLHDKRTQVTVFLDGEYVDSLTDVAINQGVKP